METNNKTVKTINEQKRQFCTFHISKRFFGVNILDTKEIIDEFKITKVHHAPDEMLGYINIRGNVHLILDLRIMLNFEKKEIDSSNRIILFTSKVGESFGILVDRIDHMVEVNDSQIEYRIHDEKSKQSGLEDNLSKLTIGSCKLDKLLIILNAKEFLKSLKNDLL